MTTPEQVRPIEGSTTNHDSKTSRKGQFLQPLAVVLIFGAVIGASLIREIRPEYFWLISTTLMALFVVILGLWIAKSPLGILINNRNLRSVSQLQTTLWTLLIIPGFVGLVVLRKFFVAAFAMAICSARKSLSYIRWCTPSATTCRTPIQNEGNR